MAPRSRAFTTEWRAASYRCPPEKRVKSISRWQTNNTHNSCALALSREKVLAICIYIYIYICICVCEKAGGALTCAPLTPAPKQWTTLYCERARVRQQESKFYSSYMKCGPSARPAPLHRPIVERMEMHDFRLGKNTQLSNWQQIKFCFLNLKYK